MSMKRWKKLILVLVALAVLAAVYGAVLIRRASAPWTSHPLWKARRSYRPESGHPAAVRHETIP